MSGGCKGDLVEPEWLFYAAVVEGVLTIERVSFLETPVDLVSKEQLLETIDRALDAGQRRQIIFATNAAKVTRCRRDPDFGRLLAQATYIIPDGAGVLVPLQWSGYRDLDRVTGVEMAELLLQQAHDNARSVFLFGASKDVVQALGQRIRRDFDRLRIVGLCDGFVSTEEENQRICQEIAQAAPDYLFIARGTPLQERWLIEHQALFDFGVAIGLGGSFDVLTGQKQRAPEWVQDAGVEWAYRTLISPKVRMKRMLTEEFPLVPKLVTGLLRGQIGKPWSDDGDY